MATIGDYCSPEWWRRRRALRKEYEKKLIAKGLDPRSLKFSDLMSRKFR